MEPQTQLSVLLDLAEEIGIAVRRVPAAGDDPEHPGGALVRLAEREVLFLDPTAAVADQIDAVAAALRGPSAGGRAELRDRFLPPEIRQLIDGEA